jgi:HSP20 family protein
MIETTEGEKMNIVSWSPFKEVEDMFSRYRQIAGRMSTDDGTGESGLQMDWRPVADISETKSEYIIKAELPEVERKDVHVSVDGGRVTIRGERKMDEEDEDATQHRIESFYGTFSRSFALPDTVDPNKISAESKNGVLKVHLPKTKEAQPTAIEIAIK